MTRVISFSLYGQRRKDTVNAVINCMLAPEVYPGWRCRFYVDDTVPLGILALLRTFEHVDVRLMPRHRNAGAMLWRFLPAAEPDVSAMISRDADSWLCSREAACVEAWLASDREFHIIRDHCYHSQRIMGGMWGVRGGVLPEMAEWVDEFSRDQTFDQRFLAERVYPRVIDQALIHRGEQRNDRGEVTDYFGDAAVPIPSYREDDEPVPGLSFREAHRQNAFVCSHCGQTHGAYIGAILEEIPAGALGAVRRLAESQALDPDWIPGLNSSPPPPPAGLATRLRRRVPEPVKRLGRHILLRT